MKTAFIAAAAITFVAVQLIPLVQTIVNARQALLAGLGG